MNYNFPPTRFVREGTLAGQLDHLLSEAEEIKKEKENHGSAHIAAKCRKTHIEVGDVWHSAETYFRKLAKELGQEYVDGIMAEIDRKNRVRGYYEEE